MRRKTTAWTRYPVLLTRKQINAMNHALDICASDYAPDNDGHNAPYRKRMLRELEQIERALDKAVKEQA